MKITAKVFLEVNDEYVFGPGRLALLKAIREFGSLRKAAKHFGMSYRWAWGRLDKAEKFFGIPLLTPGDESVSGRPKTLSAEALELIAWSDSVDAQVEAILIEAQKNMPAFLKAVPNAPIAKPVKKKITLD